MQRARGTDRALDILEHLETTDAPVSRNGLARTLECPRSTIYSIVDQLCLRNWLLVDDNGHVRLGHRVGLLGLAYSRGARFEQVARDVVQQVATTTGGLAEVNVIDHWQQLILVSAHDRTRNYLRTIEGSRHPLTTSGSARLQLVGVPHDIIRRNVPADDFRLGSGDILSFERLHAEIEQAGRQGYFMARGFMDPYIGTLSAPIRNRNQQSVATVSIVLPQADLDRRQDELIKEVVRGADELSKRLRVTTWRMGDQAYANLFQPSAAPPPTVE